MDASRFAPRLAVAGADIVLGRNITSSASLRASAIRRIGVPPGARWAAAAHTRATRYASAISS
jgi:hypothetical protein